MRTELSDHLDVVERVAQDMVEQIHQIAELVLSTVEVGGKLMLCGNGGSAADAQHLAAEYVVRFAARREAIAAIALTTDGSILTATGNDLGFHQVFARQVRALAAPGDLLMIHSTSGESTNLVLAADAARAAGAGTVALLAAGGGRLREHVDLALVVPTDSPARAQEVHITIGHLVCDFVDRARAT